MKYYVIVCLALGSVILQGMEPSKELYNAITQGKKKEVQKFAKNCVLERRDTLGRTVLHMAVVAGKPVIADILINECPKLLHIGDRQGRIPLHYAAFCGRMPMVKYLVDAKSEIERKDANLWTPLFYAVAELHLQVADLLISNGAQADRRSKKGETLIHASIPQKPCEEERETKVQTLHHSMLQYLIKQKMVSGCITDYQWKSPVKKARENLPENDMARKYLEHLESERQKPPR